MHRSGARGHIYWMEDSKLGDTSTTYGSHVSNWEWERTRFFSIPEPKSLAVVDSFLTSLADVVWAACIVSTVQVFDLGNAVLECLEGKQKRWCRKISESLGGKKGERLGRYNILIHYTTTHNLYKIFPHKRLFSSLYFLFGGASEPPDYSQ